ncbi:hypothetical protein [Natronomonas gomsonensis]|uniref:hypothetical protein n=1 Tax=Natronomonas gomsonensis TaxID=1046043 RepID=UPI0015B957AA|nr:hypothetical protein [Natronomonas gomsonensis]
MQVYGTLRGTLIWLLLGLGTAAIAASQQNQVTGFIAIGWIMLAVFSYLEYKNDQARG